jgi:hypothetical protein
MSTISADDSGSKVQMSTTAEMGRTRERDGSGVRRDDPPADRTANLVSCSLVIKCSSAAT